MAAVSSIGFAQPGANDRVDEPDKWLAQTTRSWLDDQAFVIVSGPEVRKFLQGQLTCHLDEVTATHTVCGSYCTVQGRMITSFRVAQRGDGALLLRMHASVVDNTVQTLKKYGVFSKVQIGIADDWVALAVEGSASNNLLGRIASDLAPEKNAAFAGEHFVAIQTDSDARRFEIWVQAAAAQALWQQLDGAATASSSLWRLRNIRDGIGHVEASSQELFIPQMLNFQHTGFVHFKKGCYTGQEIVARMQYLGKLKRHMFRYEATARTAPQAGDELRIDSQTQSIGNIVSAVSIAADRHEVLAVVTDDAMDNASLHIRDPNGHNHNVHNRNDQRFRRLELPYAINTGSAKT